MNISTEQVANLEEVLKLMTKYAVDQIKLGELVITKTQHPQPEQSPSVQRPQEDDEDLLFYSSK